MNTETGQGTEQRSNGKPRGGHQLLAAIIYGPLSTPADGGGVLVQG